MIHQKLVGGDRFSRDRVEHHGVLRLKSAYEKRGHRQLRPQSVCYVFLARYVFFKTPVECVSVPGRIVSDDPVHVCFDANYLFILLRA